MSDLKSSLRAVGEVREAGSERKGKRGGTMIF